MADKVFQAYSVMTVDIDLDKFREVVQATQEYVKATPSQIADFIDGGEEGWTDDTDGKHQEWISSTNADDIADWVIAGLR